MSDTECGLSDWNPIAKEFYDEKYNQYDGVNEASKKGNTPKDQIIKDEKYPYIIIRKDKQLITETLLRNFFGNALINDLEFRIKERQYMVYFHNMCSLEAAWTKIRKFPNIINYVQSNRPTPLPYEPHNNEQSKTLVETPPPSPKDSNPVDMDSRTITLSTTQSKHPEYFKTPILIKSEYTSKNSMISANDASSRYLNVKCEFALERHGAYVLKKKIEEDKVIVYFRSGRKIVTSTLQSGTQKSVEHAQLLELVSQCMACKCYTDNSCRFCQMPFCNSDCFDVLQPAHKASCDTGKPPLIEDTIVSQFNTLMLPPSGANVKITAFEQNNVVYVRSAETVDQVAYSKVLSDVMMRGKSTVKLTELPQCGQIVIYRSDTEIVRAMVLNVDNPKAIYVVCVDFGSVEITALENLHECNAYLAALPRYAVPVLLRGVPKRCITPDLREMMYALDQSHTFVLKYSKRHYNFDKGMQSVILIESELHRSLNRLITTILTPVEPSLSEAGLKENYLQHVPLPTGKDLEVVVMDNTYLQCGIVHCTILEFAYEISQMQRDIQHYGQSPSKFNSHAPPKGELCIAQYNGKWCRGLCMELVGDGYPSILFIDYGNIAAIPVEKIRPYPPQFTFPILTTEFELLGVPVPSSDKLLARMEKHLIVGGIIKCDEVIYNKADNNYSLRIGSLIE